MSKQKVINIYGGCGVGKSTVAASLFAELKKRGFNCEYVQEFAKDIAWEHEGTTGDVPKVIAAQEYIFAQQHWRMRRCSGHVDFIITDSPLLLNLAYIPPDFPLPSLVGLVKEAYALYDNLDIYLSRSHPYNPIGRFQTESEAFVIDEKITKLLYEVADYYINCLEVGNDTVPNLIYRMLEEGWL